MLNILKKKLAALSQLCRFVYRISHVQETRIHRDHSNTQMTIKVVLVSRSLIWVVFREQLGRAINTRAIQACSQNLPLPSTHNTYMHPLFFSHIKTKGCHSDNQKQTRTNHVRQWIWSDVYINKLFIYYIYIYLSVCVSFTSPGLFVEAKAGFFRPVASPFLPPKMDLATSPPGKAARDTMVDPIGHGSQSLGFQTPCDEVTGSQKPYTPKTTNLSKYFGRLEGDRIF